MKLNVGELVFVRVRMDNRINPVMWTCSRVFDNFPIIALIIVKLSEDHEKRKDYATYLTNIGLVEIGYDDIINPR